MTQPFVLTQTPSCSDHSGLCQRLQVTQPFVLTQIPSCSDHSGLCQRLSVAQLYVLTQISSCSDPGCSGCSGLCQRLSVAQPFVLTQIQGLVRRATGSGGEAFGDDRPDVGVKTHPEVGAGHLEILDIWRVFVDACSACYDAITTTPYGGDRDFDRYLAALFYQYFDLGDLLVAVATSKRGMGGSTDDWRSERDYAFDQVWPIAGSLTGQQPAETPTDESNFPSGLAFQCFRPFDQLP